MSVAERIRRVLRRVSLKRDPIPRPFFRHHRPDQDDPTEEGMHFIAFGFEAPPVDWWVGVEIDLAPADVESFASTPSASADPAGVEGRAPWWVVTDFCEQSHDADAVFVRAASEQQAADAALPELQGLREDRADRHGSEPVSHVFVAEWNARTAFEVEPRAARAELQCCGGNELARLDGHSACCPVVGAPSITCQCGHPVMEHDEIGCSHDDCNCELSREEWN